VCATYLLLEVTRVHQDSSPLLVIFPGIEIGPIEEAVKVIYMAIHVEMYHIGLLGLDTTLNRKAYCYDVFEHF
jgi:hypothetical protein